MATPALDPSQLLEAMRWRYSTKVFDASRQIAPDRWAALEETLVLSASSFGLQPYHFLVVDHPTVREQLLPFSWGQRQVVDASHYVVFASRTSVTETEIDSFVQLIARVRGVEAPALASYHGMMTDSLLAEEFKPAVANWAAHQAYIALGHLLTAAALMGIDACPMEGFEPEAYNRILDLPPRGLTAVVCCALGYRAATDKYASLPKVRFPPSQLIQHL